MRLPRFPGTARRAAVLALVLLPTGTLVWLALGYAGALSPDQARADAGDVVAFEVVARDAAGVVRFTTDADVAAAEIAQGNPFLPRNLSAYPYLERTTRLAGATGDPYALATWLSGRRAGEVVATGPLEDPFGPAPVVVVRRVHGHFSPQDVEAALGLGVGARAYAAALDANVTVVAGEEGGVRLSIDVEPGDTLHPRACRLPIGLPTRPLEVLRVNDTHLTLRALDDPRLPAYGERLDVTLRVTRVLQSHDPRAVLPMIEQWIR